MSDKKSFKIDESQTFKMPPTPPILSKEKRRTRWKWKDDDGSTTGDAGDRRDGRDTRRRRRRRRGPRKRARRVSLKSNMEGKRQRVDDGAGGGAPRFGPGSAGTAVEGWRNSGGGGVSEGEGVSGRWRRGNSSALAAMDNEKRAKAKSEARELEEKENEFHLKQAKVRADIRIKEGRAKAIDLISRNVFAESHRDFDAFVNPLTVLGGLSLAELDETKRELEEIRELDTKNSRRREFWTALIGVAQIETNKAREKEETERARVHGQASVRVEATSLHEDIDNDVVEIVSGKSAAELSELETEISQQIEGPDASEIEYWQAVLMRVSMAKTKAIVEEMHEALKAKFEQSEIEDRSQVRVHPSTAAASNHADGDDDDEDLLGADFGKHMGDEDAHGAGSSEWEEELADVPHSAAAPYDPALSPARVTEVEDGIEIIDATKDAANTKKLREEERIRGMSRFTKVTSEKRVLRGKTEEDVYNAFKSAGGRHHTTGVLANLITGTTDFKDVEKQEDVKAKALVERMMGATEDGDANFSAEVALESQAYWWHDKYRPRKPKYFNRVHTGYTWNKYNQTHYDSSNPPPKVVQGYKFNIFYPDLIDRSKAPTYRIEPDGSPNAETCLLKISAGPPYEDVAFKIVNKEWEYSHKRGFRCTFERGIFHLYVNFKRPKYRR